MRQLELCLFGPPRFQRQRQDLPLSGRKVMALVAYLAVTRQLHHRDALATLFWPEHDQSGARANLRRELSRLHKHLEAEDLLLDRDHVGLNPQTELVVDVIRFEQLLAESQRHAHPPAEVCPSCLPLLTEAVALYTADFMAGFTLPDCPEFDHWQFLQSEHLRQALAAALERLARAYYSQNQPELALPYAQRWVELEALHEPAQRQLIQLYAGTGQTAAALRQYQEYARLLQAEFELEPSAEMAQLYDSLKTEQKGKGAGEQGKRGDNLPPAPLPLRSLASSLPPQATPFIGRKPELAELGRLLRLETCRLLTLLGPGGIGKTRLALQAAAEAVDAFPEGICFVPLASATSVEFLISALAHSLELPSYERIDPKIQLLNYLREKKLLLVLDNFEQLLVPGAAEGGAVLLSEILLAAPRMKLLVTSRGRLKLQEEWSFEVQGLRFPDPLAETGAGREEMESYSAVQLFLQRARQVKADFHLSNEESPHVARICQLLGGLPLGLELAAAWVRLMPCQEIAQEIERNLDFLATSWRNVPERRRSLRTVFDHSWQLLAPAERAVFQRLSVFRGSFSRDAGERVAGASLLLLSALVDQSLLRGAGMGRYEIHELLRQYAVEKLAEENEVVREAHAHYYAAFLKQKETELEGEGQAEALAEIAADLDNVRAAWQWAVEHQDLALLGQSLASLWMFCEIRGQFQAGESFFRQAGAALHRTGAALTPVQTLLLGQLLGRQGWFMNRLGLFEPALNLQEQSVTLLRQAGAEAQPELAWALVNLGQLIYFRDGYERAKSLMQEALALAARIGEQGTMAFALHCLGQTAEFQGEYREAGPYFQESIRLFKQTGERRLRAFALNNWGRAAYAMGAYAQARTLIHEALDLRRALGDQIGIAYSLLDLGKLAKAEGHYDQAWRLMQESLKISEVLGGEEVIARCLNNLGLVACLRGDYGEAEASLHKSLALYREMGDQSRLPLVLNNLGYLAYIQGDYSQAGQYLQESLTLCRKRDKPGELASALRYLGYLGIAQDSPGRLDETRACFRQALQIVIRTGATPLILDILAGWASMLLKGHPEAAKPDQATTLLALVRAHPAAEAETLQRAEQLLTGLSPAPRADRSPQALEAVLAELVGN